LAIYYLSLYHSAAASKGRVNTMPADLNKLVPQFATKLKATLSACSQRGIEMRPYDAVRGPRSQAKLWRQSRSAEEIAAKIKEFKNAGAGFLADILDVAGPQAGDHVTNAPPGLSWHQWGEATDCFWLVNGAAEWSTQKLSNGQNGYRVYAEEAVKQGLTAGGLWSSIKDWPHTQLRSKPSPLSFFSLADIDEKMQEMWAAEPE
jgi:hypothetical protein